MKFKLKSNFQPTGDQPQAIAGLVDSVYQNNPHQTLLGVTGSGKTFTLANVIENLQVPTLVISHNKTLAAQLYQEFRDFFPNNAVSYFVSYYDYYQPESYIPATDTYIEKETDINDEIDKLRLSTTANLLTRQDVIVVASVSCIYNLGSPVDYAKNYLEITQGQILDRQTLFTRLVDMQYARNDYEITRGSFQVQGENIKIWPAYMDEVIQLKFLNTTIESIKITEPLTGTTIENSEFFPKFSKRLTLFPAKHYQSAGVDQDQALRQIKKDLAYRLDELKSEGKVVEAYRLAQKVKNDLEMIQELGYVNGIENYSRYFDGRQPGQAPYTLIDYLDYNSREVSQKPFLTIIDESHITLPQVRGMHKGDKSRKQTLIDYGFRLPSALDNRPLNFEEFLSRVPQIVYSSATPETWELQQSQNNIFEQLIRPTGLVDPKIDIRPTQDQIPNLIQEIIKRKIKSERVLVTTLTKKTAEALTDYLNTPKKILKVAKQMGIALDILPSVQYLHADIDTLERSEILLNLREGEYDVVVGINLLREGLDLPEVSLVAILEADKEGFLRSKNSLIQTMGRAARHIHGQVIMYADKTTPSMQAAIDEVDRRRKIQEEYNLTHQITPTGIQKPIRDRLITKEESETSSTQPRAFPKELKTLGWKKITDINPEALTPKDTKILIKDLTKKMNQAAKNWDFESAAVYRDTIAKLQSN